MKASSVESLIIAAGAMSVAILEGCPEDEEIIAYIEFFGLMRHNLELAVRRPHRRRRALRSRRNEHHGHGHKKHD